MKLAEHNRIQLVWLPGYMRIDGNEIADQLAREGSSHPLTGPLVFTWYICKCCEGGDQGLDEQETRGALAVHMWTKACYGLS